MGFNMATAGDPKFWPAWIRYTTLANLCFFVFMGNCYASGITTGFPLMAMEFRTDFGALTEIITWSVFALGVSNLFWMPLAMCVGKRPVILVSMVMFLAGLIWSFKAPTLHSLLGARILASFGAGSVESLGPSMIADMFMEKYFATAMALFALFLSAGSQVGPVIAGYLIADKGWRWFFILCAILNGINIFFCLLSLPETSYRRPYYHEGETAAEVDIEALEHTAPKKDEERVENVDLQRVYSKPYAGSYFKDLVSFGDRGQEESGLKALPKQFSLPFRFLLVPGALFATLSYGVMLGGIVLISAQLPQFVAPPPYLFDSKKIGLFTLTSFLGIIIAYPIAGPLTDLLSRTLTRMNGGVHKPEHRLPAPIFPFFLAPWGLILYAYTVSEGKSSQIAAVGQAFQATGLVFVPSVVLSYVVDAYPQSSGEALVLINAGKNLVAFGITQKNVQWLMAEGVKTMYTEMAGIQWAVLVLGIPLYFFGPMLRAKTQRFV